MFLQPWKPTTPPKRTLELLLLLKKERSQLPKQNRASKQSFEKDLQEMQDMLQKLRIEKEKIEKYLREKDEILKLKEEEIHSKG
ncbi:hypothetical protein V6N13_116264 [Hibiscus sabdariffa]|uniref:Uncharacterized protein n=1 Tax=Hibiscus sabdariffa TaxID=183260 RepID=A0ABR2PCK2_9ROSI